LSLLLDETVTWAIGDAELTVSKWRVEATGAFALRVWSGWPHPGDAPGSLDPAAVYAYARAGRIFGMTPSERAKHKLRLLVAAGVVRTDLRTLSALPEDARQTEIVVLHGITEFIAVERLCGCHPPGSEIAFTAEFASRWTGLTNAQARDGIQRLRARGILRRTGTTALKGRPLFANAYRVLGDE
jgi:hypothetical protein